MKIYADTNLFTNLWLDLSHSEEAMGLLAELRTAGAKLAVTRLLRMELTNAFQRLVFESRHGVQGIRVTMEAALMSHGCFLDELATGDFLEHRLVQEDQVEAEFETLVFRYTAVEGLRSYDIHHVASALVLGCDTFWTFDERAKKLAALVGLRTNA